MPETACTRPPKGWTCSRGEDHDGPCAATPAVCQTCNKPHDENWQPRHPFNDGSLPFSATFGKRRADGSRGPVPDAQGGSEGAVGPVTQPLAAPWPFDPVLRQALIDKGVLTPDDLRNAEATIRAVSAAFHANQGGADGQ